MSREARTSMRPVLRSCTLALGSLALLFAAGAARGEVASGFTREERARLVRGELVQRPRGEDAVGSWIGGIAFQAIDRPIEEVWRAVQDFDAYHAMLPGTDETRDDGVDGDARILYVHQSQLGVSAEYSLRMRFDAAEYRVVFELDETRPHDVEDARGFVELRRYHHRRTLVTWAARASLGAGLLEPMLRGLVEPWLLRVPTTMKQYLEGRGRERYRE